MAHYDVDKDDLSQFIDRLSVAQKYAENGDSDEAVIKQLREAQGILEERFPSSWYKDRDFDFDNVCEEIKTPTITGEERVEVVKDFQGKMIKKIYESENLNIEP